MNNRAGAPLDGPALYPPRGGTSRALLEFAARRHAQGSSAEHLAVGWRTREAPVHRASTEFPRCSETFRRRDGDHPGDETMAPPPDPARHVRAPPLPFTATRTHFAASGAPRPTSDRIERRARARGVPARRRHRRGRRRQAALGVCIGACGRALHAASASLEGYAMLGARARRRRGPAVSCRPYDSCVRCRRACSARWPGGHAPCAFSAFEYRDVARLEKRCADVDHRQKYAEETFAAPPSRRLDASAAESPLRSPRGPPGRRRREGDGRGVRAAALRSLATHAAPARARC